jgi:glycosyltransferase domain-containing protein
MQNNRSNLLNTLTIIIFTYKRYGYLKRLLNFYSKYNINCNFLILDSTPYENTDIEFVSYLNSNDKIKWIRYNESIFFSDKISDGCKYINTDFSVLCADDDFIFPAALIKSINFLNLNLNYSSCHGQYYHYNLINNSDISLTSIYGNAKGGKESNAKERLRMYITGETNYYPFYAVHRTKDFKLIWHYTKNYAIDWAFGEIFPSAASLILGKMKVFKTIYGIRETNNYNWYDLDRKKIMYSSNNIKKFTDGLALMLNLYDLQNIDRSKVFIAEILPDYLKIKHKEKEKPKIYNMLISFLKKHLLKKLSKKDKLILLSILIKYKTDDINLSRKDYAFQNNSSI